MAVAICIGAFGGKYVQDHWTHWKPWTMLIGLFIGIGAAALAIVRVVNEHNTAMKHKAASRADADIDGSVTPRAAAAPATNEETPPAGRVEIRTSTLDPSPAETPRDPTAHEEHDR